MASAGLPEVLPDMPPQKGGGNELPDMPIKKKADTQYDFTHGHKPTPQEVQQKNSLNAVQIGSEKLQNGSKPSQNTKQPAPKVIDWNAAANAIKQQHNPVDEQAIIHQQVKNLFPNVDKHAPTENAGELLYKYAKGFAGSFNSKLGELTGSVANLVRKSPAMALQTAGLDQVTNYLQNTVGEKANPLPDNIVGNLVSGIGKTVPMALGAAATGGGSMEAEATGLAGKYLSNSEILQQGLKDALNPITKYMMAENALTGAGEAAKQGKNILAGAAQGGVQGLEDGILLHGSMKAGEFLGSKLFGLAKKAGIVDDAGKFTEQALKSVIGTPVAFATADVANDVAHGKPIDWKKSMVQGISALPYEVPHLVEAFNTNKTVNFLSASPEDINRVAQTKVSPAELEIGSIKAGIDAEKPENTDDENTLKLKQLALKHDADIKEHVDAILNDKDGYIQSIQQSNVPDDVKQQMIDKVEQVYKDNNPFEKQKTELGNQIGDIQKQIDELSKPTGDYVKDRENVISVNELQEKKDNLDKQLDSVILKQKSNDSKNEGENRTSPSPEKGTETEQAIGQESNPVQDGRQVNEEVKQGAENAPNLQVGEEVQWTNQGVDQFDKPRKITGISDDGKYAFVEGSNTGIPIDELNKPKGEQENATQEKQIEKGGGGEHPQGNGSGETPKTGGSNSTVNPEESKGEKGQTQNVKPKKLTVKKKQAPVSETAKVYADKIRSRKSNRGNAYGGLQGVATAVYDGALETAATVIEQGGKIADAIKAAIDHIKKNSKEDDEEKIRKAITQDLSAAGLEDRYEEPEMVEANNAYLDAKVAGKFGIDAVDDIISKLKDTNLQNIVNKVKEKIKLKPNHLEQTREKVLENQGGSEEDQAALLLDQYQLKSQEEKLINDINSSTDKKEIQALQKELGKVQDDIFNNATANRMIGREASSIFRLRQVATNDGKTIENMRNEYMAGKGVKKLTLEQEQEIRDQYQGIKDAEIEVKRAKEEAIKAREEAEMLQKENDALKNIINKAKEKHANTQKGSQDRLKQIRDSIDNSKKELGKLFSNVSSGGVLQPEIYKHLGNIVKGKAEELYVKTKANIDLNHLVKSVMDEIKDIAPDIKEQDVRDAISGNYEKEPRKPKTELQKNIAELKKQAGLLKRINDVQNGIETETKKRGESSPEVKKLQKQLADLKKEAKIGGDFDKMNEGTLDTEPKTKNKPELDDRQKNINRYKQIQRQIKDIQGKIDRKEFTTPAQEAAKYKKSDAVIKAEKQLALRKFLWDKARKMDMQKNRPWYKKIGDNVLQWQRSGVLSHITTLGKLAIVVAKGVGIKIPQLLAQEGVYRAGHVIGKITGREGASGMIYGKVRPQAVAKFYSEFVRNFSIENLKNAFKGIDDADVLYGSGKYMEDYDMGSGFYNSLLEAPGRSHGYIKSFLKKPEIAFAHEQLMQGYIEKYQKIDEQLKNPDLSKQERADLESQRDMYDVSKDETLERINTLATEHGKWAIMMNKNFAVEGFRGFMNRYIGEKTPSWRTKAAGYLLKSEYPILKLPVNYVGRYFLYKYGLVKAITGGGGQVGLIEVALKGTDKLSDQHKDLISRSLTYGSMGAGAFVAGYLFHKQVKRNDDGTITIGKQKFSKITSNIISDSPLEDSFLSGSTYGDHMNQRYGEKHAYDWISNLAESDMDAVKKMPFVSQLNYGFISNFAISLYKKDEDTKRKSMLKALNKKVETFVDPGIVQDVTEILDPNVSERTPNNFWQTIEKHTPVLSKKVPR